MARCSLGVMGPAPAPRPPKGEPRPGRRFCPRAAAGEGRTSCQRADRLKGPNSMSEATPLPVDQVRHAEPLDRLAQRDDGDLLPEPFSHAAIVPDSALLVQ